ncbi:hypothetical protein [Methylomonas sp. AM2-LC]|uniref:hypothetical protein n=1 Tax=Methylomonas sp. AM2-LC TaxID=3153301 RepID=UPI003265C268
MELRIKKHLGTIIMFGGSIFFSMPNYADSYSFTTLTDTNTVPGSNYPVYADHINNSGVVVGILAGNLYGQGFIYNGSNFSSAQGGNNLGINNNGQLTGSNLFCYGYCVAGTNISGFISNGSSITSFKEPNAYMGPTYSLGINDNGVVAGYFVVNHPNDIYNPGQANVGNNGYIYDGKTYTTIDVPNSSETIATDINNNGEVVGYFGNATGIHGFEYNLVTINLGFMGLPLFMQLPSYTTINDPNATSGTWITGINNNGEISGYYNDATGAHGFIYNGSTYTTIDDPLAVAGTTKITSINDSRQIVGQFTDSLGITQSFIASPTAVPLPSSLWLFASAPLGFLGFNSRKTIQK